MWCAALSMLAAGLSTTAIDAPHSAGGSSEQKALNDEIDI
jgi:hypothetical protein